MSEEKPVNISINSEGAPVEEEKKESSTASADANNTVAKLDTELEQVRCSDGWKLGEPLV